MKDYVGKLQYQEKVYPFIFNLNVMEQIQEEYGTVNKWAGLTDGEVGEPDAKAVIFGFTCMINEALDMEADEKGTEYRPLTKKQVGRLITAVGLANATNIMNDAVIESSKSAEKNV